VASEMIVILWMCLCSYHPSLLWEESILNQAHCCQLAFIRI
jgi:hypothetical protein